LAFYILGALASFIFMPSAYVLGSPRLLYQSALGVAVAWSLPITAQGSTSRQRATCLAVMSFIVVAMAWSSTRYLLYMKRVALDVKTSVIGINESMRDAENPILVINFPSAFADRPYILPLGDYAPIMLPSLDTEDLSDITRLNGLPGKEITNLTVSELKPHQPWKYEVGYSRHTLELSELNSALREYKSVFVGVLADVPRVRPVGGLIAENQAPGASLARYNEQLALLEAAADNTGSDVEVDLTWQCLAPLSEEYQIFIHLIDRDNIMVYGQDVQPLTGMSSLASWKTGDVWRDVRHLTPPAELPAGTYQVVIGLYTISDTQRLNATDADGAPLPNNAFRIGEVTLP